MRPFGMFPVLTIGDGVLTETTANREQQKDSSSEEKDFISSRTHQVQLFQQAPKRMRANVKRTSAAFLFLHTCTACLSTMPPDPCQQLPYAASTPPAYHAAGPHTVHHPAHYAEHHAVGRIWRRRPTRFLALGPPDPGVNRKGCETHAANFHANLRNAPERPRAPFTPAALMLAGGFPFAVPLWLGTLHFMHVSARKHHSGHSIVLAEPNTLFLFLGAVLALQQIRLIVRQSERK